MTSPLPGYYQNELRDLRGNAITSAVVDVFDVGTLTPAIAYSDTDRTPMTASPLAAAAGLNRPGIDVAANIAFYAEDTDEDGDPLEYDVRVTYPGGTFTFRAKPAPAALTSTSFAPIKARLAQGSRLANSFFDDFDRSNRVLNGDEAPSGQEWFVTGPGIASATITDGLLTGPDNFYAVLGDGSAITRVAGTFSFVTGVGTDRSVASVTLAADKLQGALANMLHLTVSPDAWELTKRQAAGSFVSMANGLHNLRTDGTVYGASMEISAAAGTVTVVAPSGQRVTVTDAAVTAIDPRYGWIQYVGDTGVGAGAPYKGRWHSFTTGPSIAAALRAEGGGAAAADLDLFFGSGLTRRQKISGVLSGAAGWYRIATRVTEGTFILAGRVVVSASDAGQTGAVGRRTYWDFDVATYTGAALAPKMGQRFADEYFPAVSQARLSRDDTAFTIGLDIFKVGADPCGYSIEFEGAFLPVQAPVAGATALATASTVLTAAPGSIVNLAQQAANADTSGATLGQLETEVNQLKALLRSVGLLTS